VNGVDVFHPNTGEVRSDGAEGIACWFIDTDYNEESFFVRHAYFLGANDPYSALKTTLKAEINAEARESLHSDTSRPFDKPKNGRIAVKVINHLGDEVMKVFCRLSGKSRATCENPKHQIRNPKQARISQTAENSKHGAKTAAFDSEDWKFGFALDFEFPRRSSWFRLRRVGV
jgi:hypothetical protein